MMRSPVARLPAPLGVALAVVALAALLGGCGSAAAPLTPSIVNTRPPGGTGSEQSSTLSSSDRRAAEVPDADRLGLARREAQSLLDLTVLPPGSRRSATDPDGDRHLLGSPSQTVADPNFVDRHRFYVALLSPAAITTWLRSHPGRGARVSGFGAGGALNRVYTWSVTESWPEVPDLFDNRLLVFTVAALPGKGAAIRVDAQVTWLPAKPPGDLIGPAGAVTVSLSRGLNPGEVGHPPVTTTDPATIRAIRGAVSSLQVLPPGMSLCPADFGQSLRITFREKAGERPFALLVADTSGCEQVVIDRHGHAVSPPLWGIERTSSGKSRSFAAVVERLTGFTADTRQGGTD